MHRYELTDEHYAKIEPHLHDNNDGQPEGNTLPHRPILDGIFWRLYNGPRWSDVPERYGKHNSVHNRFNR